MFSHHNKANPAQRRYIRRILPAMFGYVVVLMACTWAIKHWHPAGMSLFLLSLLPALPLLAAIVVMGMYLVEERDEFVRSRLVTAMVGGIGVTLAITTVWGFLENGGAVGHFPTFLTFPIWCGSFGLVQCARSLHERMQGDAA